MDSQWFNQETRMKGYDLNDTGMNRFHLNNAGKEVDLTLKLGLPGSDLYLPQLEHHTNMNFSGPYTQGKNQYGGEKPEAEHDFNANEFKYSTEMGSHPYNMQPNALGQFSGSSVGGVAYNKFNPNLAPTTPVTMNSYILLDPPRRFDRELGSSSSNARRKGIRRQRVFPAGVHNNQSKICTNYNCNTNDTPMWRKGPLGPKTLCNACGIKYRKEEEKKRAKEAANNSNNLNG